MGDPAKVQKHIKKCFEGIKTLQLTFPGKGNMNRTIESVGMQSGDAEHIPNLSPVIVDGPVELWLVEIEKMMVLTLQKMLPACVAAFKGKKEKWIKEWPGQLLIST